MADQIRTAQYFKLTIGDKSGTLAHMLAPLHEAGVNLLAVHAFPRNRRTQVDVVPEDPTAFKDITKPLKWKVQGPKVCFRRQTEGRVLQSNISEVRPRAAGFYGLRRSSDFLLSPPSA